MCNIKIHPNLAAKAMLTGHENAYALYSLAKSHDPNWTWKVNVVEPLRIEGWSESKIYRARKDAESLGWIKPDKEDDRWFLMSYEKVALSLGVARVGRFATYIPQDAYKSNSGLKQAFLRSYLMDKTDQHLSRAFVSAETGIAPRTLTKWLNHKKDIWIERGYVHFYTGKGEVTRTMLEGAKENHPGAFLAKGQIYYQTPNRYHVTKNSDVIASGSYGASKLNRRLKKQLVKGDSKTSTPKLARRYHETEQSFQSTVKSVNRGKKQDAGVYLVKVKQVTRFDYPVAVFYEEAFNPLAM